MNLPEPEYNSSSGVPYAGKWVRQYKHAWRCIAAFDPIFKARPKFYSKKMGMYHMYVPKQEWDALVAIGPGSVPKSCVLCVGCCF